MVGLRQLAAFLLLVLSPSTVWPEYFLGADYTRLGTNITFNDGSSLYTANPIRLRAGWRGELAGIEVDFLSRQEQSQPAWGGDNYNFKTGAGFGAYLYLHQKWVYAKLGGTWYDTTLTNLTSGISDNSTVAQATFAVGIEYALFPNLFLNADYTYAVGSTGYSTANPDQGSADLTTQGGAIGITVGF